MPRSVAEKIVQARSFKSFGSLEVLAGQFNFAGKDLELLVATGAFAGLTGNRHRAHSEVAGTEKALPVLCRPRVYEALQRLARVCEAEDIAADYPTTGLTLRRHPLALIRERLARLRPGTASGVIFVTLEDETGLANLIVWPKIAEA